MYFEHDGPCGVTAGIDLVNTHPCIGGIDGIKDISSLSAFLLKHKMTPPPPSPKDVQQVANLRTELLHILVEKNLEKAATSLNQIVREAGAYPYMAQHDGLPWHMDWQPEGASAATHVSAQVCVALMDHLCRNGYERLRICSGEACKKYFVDLTKNNKKRFCDNKTCGNRAHVAAYRARQAAS